MTCKRVEAHAKVNLTLHIAARRPDGYHDIETVMKTIPLHDTVTVFARDSGISIDCTARYVPTDGRNIAYKAAKLFFNETGITGGAHMKIVKRIPVCGGLGGGSTDAAAVINALDVVYKTKMTVGDKQRLAAVLGSDVPFFIDGKTAFCTGRGERLEPLTDNLSCGFGAAVWGLGASTAAMYAEVDKAERPYRSSDIVIKALETHDFELLCGSIFNDFEPVCNKLRFETAHLKTELLKSGASAAMLSGSGASVYGIFETQEIADRIISNVKAKRHAKR